jgi:hypothetical protein
MRHAADTLMALQANTEVAWDGCFLCTTVAPLAIPVPGGRYKASTGLVRASERGVENVSARALIVL